MVVVKIVILVWLKIYNYGIRITQLKFKHGDFPAMGNSKTCTIEFRKEIAIHSTPYIDWISHISGLKLVLPEIFIWFYMVFLSLSVLKKRHDLAVAHLHRAVYAPVYGLRRKKIV